MLKYKLAAVVSIIIAVFNFAAPAKIYAAVPPPARHDLRGGGARKEEYILQGDNKDMSTGVITEQISLAQEGVGNSGSKVSSLSAKRKEDLLRVGFKMSVIVVVLILILIRLYLNKRNKRSQEKHL